MYKKYPRRPKIELDFFRFGLCNIILCSGYTKSLLARLCLCIWLVIEIAEWPKIGKRKHDKLNRLDNQNKFREHVQAKKEDE